MGFTEAVRTVLTKKYATFSGRASRSEYWWFQLFYWIALIVLGILTVALSAVFNANENSLFFFIPIGLLVLAMLLPVIALQVRRFHDRDMSGWWYLGAVIVGNVPFVGILVWIAVFVISCLKGTDGPNRFGPDPLRPESTAEVFA
ncbi:DUF805 domain-containing protein [Aquamicrobium defluvii]|uniref:Membrane protein n=1 Tax=Aquamicrobium defluvii TaxID=69279 RepID=A0A011TF03_9HYPH|nr:DUF805 domain-containing protein [Aquamicrobium defluvii]EXL02427.1 membrane protein [Aquamicrobium defluvii]EZQ13078.1 membrane protein [Halopseudomonas bauzanensis]TDR32940.1 uncharacterized membrane protein YhaH (DUF805 family) [Aquamicrobium defluvii]